MSDSMKTPSIPTSGPPRSIFGGPYTTPPPGNGKAAVPKADTPIRDTASPVLESIKRKRSGTDDGTDFAKRALSRDGALSTAKASPVRTLRNAGAAKSKLKFKPTCGRCLERDLRCVPHKGDPVKYRCNMCMGARVKGGACVMVEEPVSPHQLSPVAAAVAPNSTTPTSSPKTNTGGLSGLPHITPPADLSLPALPSQTSNRSASPRISSTAAPFSAPLQATVPLPPPQTSESPTPTVSTSPFTKDPITRTEKSQSEPRAPPPSSSSSTLNPTPISHKVRPSQEIAALVSKHEATNLQSPSHDMGSLARLLWATVQDLNAERERVQKLHREREEFLRELREIGKAVPGVGEILGRRGD